VLAWQLAQSGQLCSRAKETCPRAPLRPDGAAAGADDIDSLLLSDLDGDGVIERDDNCTGARNPDQADLDRDGVGDLCDEDADGDGLVDTADPHPGDTDNDGIPNATDTDDDGDRIADPADNCPVAANADQADVDADGVGDSCDPDADGDGTPDLREQFFATTDATGTATCTVTPEQPLGPGTVTAALPETPRPNRQPTPDRPSCSSSSPPVRSSSVTGAQHPTPQ
jgi:Thrombospondin type 3 repeat